MSWLHLIILLLSVYVMLEAISGIAGYWSAAHMLQCFWEAIEDAVWSIIEWIGGGSDD